MAKPHTPEKGPSNPEVSFERSDVEVPTIIVYGLSFAAMVVVSAIFIFILVPKVLDWFDSAKKSDIPQGLAVASKVTPEGQPGLEAIEDLEQKKPKLLPTRAADYYAKQKDELAGKVKDTKILSIQKSMDDLASKLPAGKRPTPRLFSVRNTSDAAAGRVETGGQ